MSLHPLLARLADRTGAVVVSPDSVEAFAAAPGEAVLFFAGDPVRFPEALDIAVVLPELHALHGGSFRIGIVPRDGEDVIARRYGVQRWPSLVFLRAGGYLATLSGMKDWEPFVAQVRNALAAAPSRLPSVGIPVVGADAARGCGPA
jgi:hydrogenase-1 operon protein HyaE